MEEVILISYRNDFIFCPVSIYFHKLYGNLNVNLYNSSYQVNGLNAHKSIDNHTYSTRKDVLQGMDVYCEKYGIMGKIDVFDIKTGILTERKRTVSKVYDGYIFQVYAQYYALIEMGYVVNKLRIHSVTDNKNYDIELPEKNIEMKNKFEKLLNDMHNFDIENFVQINEEKCRMCIYEPACDRSNLC